VDELYLGDRESYLRIIWDLKHDKDLMIVGHNEGISDFASYLLDQEIHLKTGHYLCIEFDAKKWNETSKGTGEIVTNFRPSVHFPD
jgi:phosphohistidine phosphatase SixA